MRAVISILICLLIIGAGAGVTSLVLAARASNHDAAAKTQPAEIAKNIKISVVEPAEVEDRILLTGNILPWEDVTLSAEIAGSIHWQGVDEGDSVTKGQELLKIDISSVTAAHEQAKARLGLAAQELERISGLQRGGIASPQELDRVLTEQRVAEAELNSADTRLKKSLVTAPFEGTIDKLHKELDEWVDTGAPLIRLVQTRKVKAVIGIPERDIVHFKIGDTIALTAEAYPGREFVGSIYRIATTAESTTRTFITEIEVDNAEQLLKPGMIIRARLVRQSFPDALTMPIFAVLSVENQRFAAVEVDGRAEIRPIELGVLQDNHAHVKSGLNPGDHLIVVGQRDVRDGELVQVIEVVP
jgi:membrane fusion protein (multidrug efflux system)